MCNGFSFASGSPTEFLALVVHCESCGDRRRSWGEAWELRERDSTIWARRGNSGSGMHCSGRGLGALGAGFVVPVKVWEGQTLANLSEPKNPGGSPKELLTRGISILGEFWELWESSGRGVGVLGAGFVALGEVWEPWELDLSCLSRFGRVRL